MEAKIHLIKRDMKDLKLIWFHWNSIIENEWDTNFGLSRFTLQTREILISSFNQPENKIKFI